MSIVPEDVYLDIFARLPVKSLLRCKCVCRFWFRVISSRDFVKVHHVHAKQGNNPTLLYSGLYRLYTIDYKSISSAKGTRSLYGDAVNYQYPFENRNNSVTLFGYCNGLVYLWCWSRELFCLWNPATKEYKVIPKSPSKEKYVDMMRDICMCGFGYDPKIDDYKVINVRKLSQNIQGKRCLIDVYTLGTNSWKPSSTEIDMVPLHREIGVLVNGALHWTSGRKRGNDSKLIISLDISNEKFMGLEPPKEALENTAFAISVGALEGLLCVLNEVRNSQLDVWVMKDYGVRESWIKRYIITHREIMKYNDLVEFQWSFKNGEIVFRNDEKLVIYDPKQESARELYSMRFFDCSNAVIYCESLVSVNSGTYVGGN